MCNANLEALKDLGVAIDTVDFVCSDGTAYNSSLNIKAKRHNALPQVGRTTSSCMRSVRDFVSCCSQESAKACCRQKARSWKHSR